MSDELMELLDHALDTRAGLLVGKHTSALRLFNGFLEGWPDLSVELFGTTLVLYDYSDHPAESINPLTEVRTHLTSRLPWVKAVIVKTRSAADSLGGRPDARRGVLVQGSEPERSITENGVCYALDLTLNQDASFYLDARNLRTWLKETLNGKTLLNTFAYTGSLGMAALAGGATRVVQADRNGRFLMLAENSAALNGVPKERYEVRPEDFFNTAAHFKRSGELFDCVIVDPPFFSTTSRGRVDLERESQRVINKVRPLVKDGGWLVTINNALFLSGADYYGQLQELCADGYLAVEVLIPVPEDCTGYAGTRVGAPPVDPAPFNHSTKIAVLKVKRKSSGTA
jgi:23S rRNA (cytosine1962-C5)-methyltransferase